MPDDQPLSPAAVSRRLFALSPDRDERAPQIAMETLLTLRANGYQAPGDIAGFRSPKRRNGALRSLALGANFFEGVGQAAGGGYTKHGLGERLAAGADFGGSQGLPIAAQALRALVDHETGRGSNRGAILMQPFHETLLWYDGRKSGEAAALWSIRKVYMRGTGITLARVLLDPPEQLDVGARAAAADAVAGIRDALNAPSPLTELARRLHAAAPDEAQSAEEDEREAWRAGGDEKLRPLASRLIRHAAGIVSQRSVSAPLKLQQLRIIIALDLAYYMIRRSWDYLGTADADRYLLAAFTPEPRRGNPVRVRSEASYLAARQKVSQALVGTLADAAGEFAAAQQHQAGGGFRPDWSAQFGRSRPRAGLRALESARSRDDFERAAERCFEDIDGYDRSGAQALRVVLESVEMLLGTGRYRYLRPGPGLLSALVGALSPRLPLASSEFFAAVREEWGMVIGEAQAWGTSVSDQVDGGELRRNARLCERVLTSTGLALSLSDQTCMVERARAR